MMIAPIAGSRSASRTARVRACTSSSLNALSTCGRFKVSRATRLARSCKRTEVLSAMVGRASLFEEGPHTFMRVLGSEECRERSPLEFQTGVERRLERGQHGGFRHLHR